MISKNIRLRRHVLTILSVLTFVIPASVAAQGAGSVIKWQDKGLRFEITPLGADQVRAFFIGRGFASENADIIARTGCIFRSSIGNAGASMGEPKVEVRLREWQIISKGKAQAPRTREDWAVLWKERGANEDAQTALHWSLFPTDQVFSPTDYNWGMISFALLPAARFDLKVVWHTGKTRHTKKLENLECGQ